MHLSLAFCLIGSIGENTRLSIPFPSDKCFQILSFGFFAKAPIAYVFTRATIRYLTVKDILRPLLESLSSSAVDYSPKTYTSLQLLGYLNSARPALAYIVNWSSLTLVVVDQAWEQIFSHSAEILIHLCSPSCHYSTICASASRCTSSSWSSSLWFVGSLPHTLLPRLMTWLWLFSFVFLCASLVDICSIPSFHHQTDFSSCQNHQKDQRVLKGWQIAYQPYRRQNS